MAIKGCIFIFLSDADLKYGVQCSEDNNWSSRAIPFDRIPTENDDVTIIEGKGI